MGKKSKLSVKRFAIRIFKNRIVRDALELILVVAIIYFGVNGVLMLALRTDTPWMAVVSDSMKHSNGGWREYFEVRNIYTSRFPLQDGFERGDMLIIQGVSSVSEIAIGDVVVVDRGPDVIPLVHRVVEIWQENGVTYLRTKGDYKDYEGERFKAENVLGKVVLVIPDIGYLSLWLSRR